METKRRILKQVQDKPFLNSGTIFIIDDVSEHLDLLSRILTDSGYKVRTAKTGRDAIALINAEVPDLILLDIMLPDISGYEICTTLKANDKTSAVPVIFVSALVETEVKRRGFNTGGVDFITKPFIHDEVLIRVQTHLDLSSLRSQLEHQAVKMQLKNEELQIEVNERKLAAEKLAESFVKLEDGKTAALNLTERLVKSLAKLEDGKTAALNLSEDLKIEIELRTENEKALRESELKYRNLIEYSPDAIFINQEYKVTLVNKACLNLFGANNEQELLGKNLFELFHPDYHENIKNYIHIFKDQQTAPKSIELFGKPVHGKVIEEKIIRLDGKTTDVEVVAAPFPFGGINVVHFILRDITERRQAREKIRKLNSELELRVAERTRQLEQTYKELEAFSYSVSHDLRSPLRGIDGFSMALYDDYFHKLDDKAKDYIERIRAATKRMDELIDSLLNLSKVSRIQLIVETVNLSLLATEISDALKNSDKTRTAEIIIQGNLTAKGDTNLLRIVLENLLNNAWKFTSKKEKAVIEFGAVKEKSKIVYYVKDNGIGFDMKYANKLFGAFQRLHSAKEYPGSGVGLTTVQRIIRRHNGEVWVEGEVDKGAAFYFTIANNFDSKI